MVAVNGETSGRWYAHRRMLTRMKVDPEGKLVLRDQPRINSKTVDLDALRRLPKNTLGFAYTRFLDVNKVTPDSRLPVRFVDDPELAYVMQRYRETHDLVHTVLGMRTNMQGEVAVKWVEGIQTGLPMCLGGALLAPLRYNPRQRENYVTRYLEWALKNGFKSRFLLAAYFEKRWDQDLDEFRREFRIDPLPNIAATQKKQK
ncbi:unnamed protein product [Cyprideis torosa]|uniref:Ubiquinone biosynthesis protein COQ4 homolog, mitochondrial n=1 Tax=Cyprideis torosa TaxID=163714 RepID=A0A7R8ZKL9_9CRUS|nr:unnamed protein product [Cyprideis torosa]CAG0891306.1 unnamed protein product [Cyprideis torosa]